MRRVVLILALPLSVLVVPLHGQSGPGSAGPVFLLVDYSYSMSLPVGGGPSRLQVLIAAALDDPIVSGANGRLGAMAFEDRGNLDTLLSFPSTLPALRKALRTREPWGASPVIDSLRDAASHLSTTFPGQVVHLVFLTDGEDEIALFTPPAEDPPGEIADGRVQLSVFSLADAGPASVAPLLSRWAKISGGSSVPIGEGFGISASVDSGSTEDSSIEQSFAPTESGVSSFLRVWLTVLLGSCAAATLAGVVLVALLAVRRQQRNHKIARHNAIPTRVKLLIRSTGGREELEISRFPATVGTNIGDSVHLGPKGKAGHVRCKLSLVGDAVKFTSEKRHNVNGVPRTEWTLEQGDQVRMGNYRITFGSVKVVRHMPDESLSFLRFTAFPAGAIMIAAAAFALLTGPLRRVAPGPTVAPDPLAASAQEQPAASRTESLAPGTESLSTSIAPAFSFSASDTPNVARGAAPIVVSPGDRLPEVDLDFLAIHAHPDDESLDFGALLARLTASGYRGGVLLMTDGSSGRDQYPRRSVTETYPAYNLDGAALGQVRVGEAARAMKWMGIDYYFRLGLINNPYNGIDDQLSFASVVGQWGGRQEAVNRIARLIEEVSPEIIVSPDGPRGPYEHFEHEATGVLVWEALQQLSQAGKSTVQAHLMPIDPLQRHHYEQVLTLPAWTNHPVSGVPYRVLQVLALSEHLTQRDAAVVGIETRLGIRNDYIAIGYWNPAFALPKLAGSLSSLQLSSMALEKPSH